MRVRSGQDWCEIGGGSRGDAEGASAGGEEGRAEASQGQFEEVAAGEVVFGHIPESPECLFAL